MNTRPLLPALLLMALAASTGHAATNVALGKPVTLDQPGDFATGSGYFGGGTGGYTLPSPSIVTDGIFQAGYWATGIWWDEQNSGQHSHVVVDLQGQYLLSGFAVMADGNDSYLLEVRNGLGQWVAAWSIPEFNQGGLSQRSTVLATPVSGNALRLSAVHDFSPGHDYAYAVSEIQAAAVPEPAAWTLLVAGLPLLLGLAGRPARRR